MPKQIKGNGLGLSITKVAVGKLGGSIEINSEIDYGKNVFIKIPNK